MKLRNKEIDEIFEVITFGYINSNVPNGNGDYPVEFIVLEVVDEEGDLYEYQYKSLKDLNAIWEDCTQKEPLIKDEKIRKAVRAWAEACRLKYATYKQSSNEFYDPDTRGGKFAIKFTLKPIEVLLDDGKCYTLPNSAERRKNDSHRP